MVLSLESHYYSDPSILASERQRIFRRTWQLIGAEACIGDQSSYLATRMAGFGLFVIRGGDGTLRAFHNVCRHRGSRLLDDGLGNCSAVRCPYHGWEYDDRGRLIDTPWFGDESPFPRAELSLEPIALRAWRGLLFAAIEPEVTLEEQIGDLPQALAEVPLETYSPLKSERLTAPVNWKAYIDQFVEYYHTPTVHSPDKSVDVQHYSAMPGRGMMTMLAPTGSAFYGGRWLWAWPNWTLSVFPGGVKTSRVDPVAVDQVAVHFEYLFADASAGAEATRQRVVEATRSIFEEDVLACTRAQANYASGAYRPGPLHPQHEQAVAYFHQRVRNSLSDVRNPCITGRSL